MHFYQRLDSDAFLQDEDYFFISFNSSASFYNAWTCAHYCAACILCWASTGGPKRSL